MSREQLAQEQMWLVINSLRSRGWTETYPARQDIRIIWGVEGGERWMGYIHPPFDASALTPFFRGFVHAGPWGFNPDAPQWRARVLTARSAQPRAPGQLPARGSILCRSSRKT